MSTTLRTAVAGDMTVTAAATINADVVIGVAPVGLVLFPPEAADLAVALLKVAGDDLSAETIEVTADALGVPVRALFVTLRSVREVRPNDPSGTETGDRG